MKKKKKETHADHEKKTWKSHNVKLFFDILQSGTFSNLVIIFWNREFYLFRSIINNTKVAM